MTEEEKTKYEKYSKINKKLGQWFKMGLDMGISVKTLETKMKQELIKSIHDKK